jgi:hypothetical protein
MRPTSTGFAEGLLNCITAVRANAPRKTTKAGNAQRGCLIPCGTRYCHGEQLLGCRQDSVRFAVIPRIQ